MLRLSATTIEQYRLLVEEDYVKESDLIDQVRGIQKPTWQMRAGSAWHSILERKELPLLPIVVVDDYQFAIDDIRIGHKLRGNGVCEAKMTKELFVDGEAVTLVGRTDLVNGLLLTDHKVKFYPWDPRDYEQSLQWRLYAWMFGASAFRYLAWVFKDPGESKSMELKELAQACFWAYDGMASDCTLWVSRFVCWLKSRGLTQHLERAA